MNIYRKIKEEEGGALVLVLITMTVLFILGTTLLKISLSDNKFAILQEKNLKAYYIARAGAEATADYIKDNEHSFEDINNLIVDNDINENTWTPFEDGKFKISFGGNAFFPIIHSLGTYESAEEKASVKLRKITLFNDAITVLNNLHIKHSNCEIFGGVNTLKPTDVGVSGHVENIHGDIKQVDADYPLPNFPNFPYNNGVDFNKDLEIDSKGDIVAHNVGNVDIKKNNIFVNLKENEILEVRADTFTGSGSITVNGDGIFILYVDKFGTNKKPFKGNINIVEKNSIFILVVKDEVYLQTGSGNTDRNFLIYSPEADVLSMANYDIKGSIIANNITFESGSNITYEINLEQQKSNNSIPIYLLPEIINLPSLGYEIIEWSN